jgi:hypothetical protein
MLTASIGLVDMTGSVQTRLLTAAASALNVQVTRDLPQFWPVKASVTYLPDPAHIPQGVWPVRIVHGLGPGEGGCHLGANNQPFAKVINTPGGDEWTLDASHEICQMLVDPSGNALQTSTTMTVLDGCVQEVSGAAEYIVEVCEPCSSVACSYEVDGVMVSDFISPMYFDRIALPGARYSYAGSISTPRQILPGGRLSWIDPLTSEIRQIVHADLDAEPVARNLGSSSGPSLRAFVDGRTHLLMRANRPPPNDRARLARRVHRDQLAQAAGFRSHWFV